MLLEKGIDWHQLPVWYKFGTFAKREKFQKETHIPGGTTTISLRTRIVSKDIQMSFNYTKEQEDWIIAKYWFENFTFNVSDQNKTSLS